MGFAFFNAAGSACTVPRRRAHSGQGDVKVVKRRLDCIKYVLDCAFVANIERNNINPQYVEPGSVIVPPEPLSGSWSAKSLVTTSGPLNYVTHVTQLECVEQSVDLSNDMPTVGDLDSSWLLRVVFSANSISVADCWLR